MQRRILHDRDGAHIIEIAILILNLFGIRYLLAAVVDQDLARAIRVALFRTHSRPAVAPDLRIDQAAKSGGAQRVTTLDPALID
jgi:hypothetical protein